MGSEFTFYDYFDADGARVNVIRAWLNGEGKEAKAWFTIMIGQLEASPPPGFQDSVWKRPYTYPLEDEWDGFIEIRKTGSVQYRVIAQMKNRNVFLIGCGIHKGQYFKIDVTPATASNRVSQMISNPERYRREHEY